MNPLRKLQSRWKQRAAFTFVELLIVLTVIGLLACVAIPSLAGVKGQTRTAHCASNLRQFTLAMLLYGSENNERLPPGPVSSSFAFLIAPSFTDQLARYGARRQEMYCPAFPGQNVDVHWNFALQYRVIGYATTLSGLVAQQWQNVTTVPQQPSVGSVRLAAPHASQRVLVADVVLNGTGNSTNYNTMLTYNWTDVVGGSPVHHRTSHAAGKIPAGANLGMLDGHVEWREFRGMISHSSGSPNFYW